MRKSVALFFTIMLFAGAEVSGDAPRPSEFVQLINERSRLLESLEGQPSPDEAKTLRARLKKIEERIRDLGVEIPAPPAPLMGEADRTDQPLPRPASPSTEGKRYRFDISVSPSFNDNYFQAVAGAPKQSVWLTNVSTSFQIAIHRRGRNQLTAGMDVQHIHVEGIDRADWNSYGARLSYATRNNQISAQGVYRPRRLTFVTGDGMPGLATTTALGMDYSRKLSSRARMRLFYRYNDVRYPGFENRDLVLNMAAGDFQYQFHRLFNPGIGFEWTEAQGSLENYSYNEKTPVLILGARFGRVATLSLRYRYRERIYPITDALASNFGRKDRRHDAYTYLNFSLGKHLGLTIYGSYLQNESTRPGRGFQSLGGGITLICMLPGR